MSKEGDVPIVCSSDDHCSQVGMVCNMKSKHCEKPQSEKSWFEEIKEKVKELYSTRDRAFISSIVIGLIISLAIAYFSRM